MRKILTWNSELNLSTGLLIVPLYLMTMMLLKHSYWDLSQNRHWNSHNLSEQGLKLFTLTWVIRPSVAFYHSPQSWGCATKSIFYTSRQHFGICIWVEHNLWYVLVVHTTPRIKRFANAMHHPFNWTKYKKPYDNVFLPDIK